MAHDTKKSDAPKEPRCVGVLAEFDNPGTVLHAAEQVRDAGYTRWDVHSPFPLHGIDDIVNRPTILPWICAIMAVLGITTALVLQWYTNGFDYPFRVSGKEFFALPATAPVDFELTILFTAFGAFFGCLFLSKLPRLSNPLLRNELFRKRGTTDRMHLVVYANDPRFSRGKTLEFLRSLGATASEEILAPVESTKLPRPLIMAGIVLAILALVPPIMIVRKRNTFSSEPRIHVVMDMDFQPKFKAQKVNSFFADSRADRPTVPGAIPRGTLEDDVHYYRGIDPGAQLASLTNASFQEPANPPQDPAQPAAPAAPAQPVDTTPWAKTFPPKVLESLKADSAKLMRRGQERFNIYCSVCHGLTGLGDGLVSRRALELAEIDPARQSTWVKPLSLHDQPIQEQPVGKLFGTITNGIRKMPAYGAQVPPEDRWAIVLYIKALQRSQNASASDVPADILSNLQKAK